MTPLRTELTLLYTTYYNYLLIADSTLISTRFVLNYLFLASTFTLSTYKHMFLVDSYGFPFYVANYKQSILIVYFCCINKIRYKVTLTVAYFRLITNCCYVSQMHNRLLFYWFYQKAICVSSNLQGIKSSRNPRRP